MLQRYLLVWLSLLSLLAYGWAQFSWPYDPFRTTAPNLKYLITFTMLIIGGLIPPEEVRQIFKKWKMVLGGTAIQFLIMPALAYSIGTYFELPEELFVGIILVGTVPGAMASNVLTLLSKGNISYSVCLTTSATLLSPFLVPILFYLTVRVDGIDNVAIPFKTFVFLLINLFIPVLTGYFLARKFEACEKIFQKVGSSFANLAILWIIAVVVNGSQPKIADGVLPVSLLVQLLIVLLLINLLGYLGGFWGGKLLPISHPMRRALTLEIGMQNAGLGAVMATDLFKEQSTIALPPALYAFVCMFTGTILAQYWSKTPPDSEEM